MEAIKGANMDLQLFKKGKTKVVTQQASVPKATPQETERYNMMNEYLRATVPTAMALQRKGADMLLNAPGVVNVDYSTLGNQAAQGARQLQGDLQNLRNNTDQMARGYQQAFLNDAAANNQALGNVSNMSNQTTNMVQQGLGNLSQGSADNAVRLAQMYGNTANRANMALGGNMAATLGVAAAAANELGKAGQQANQDNTALIQQLRGATGNANQALGQSYQNYGNTATDTSGRLKQYEQGQQNNAFVDNKTKVISDQLKGTLGSAVNNLAQRGVLNSSVANRVFENIGDNVADSMNRSYNQDLGLQADLAGRANQVQQQGQQLQDQATARQLGNVDNFVQRAYTMGNQNYGQQAQNALQRYQILNQGLGQSANLTQQMTQNRMNALGQQQNLYGQNIANQGNYLNMLADQSNRNIATQSGLIGQMGNNNQQALAHGANLFQQNVANQANMIDQANGLNLAPMQALNIAQNSSIDIPSKIFALATGQIAPNNDAWQTLINNRYRMANPENIHISEGGGGGGFFGGLGSALVGNFCVAENTEISTPYGQMVIQDIVPSDYVLDGEGNEVVVTQVLDPKYEDVFLLATEEKEIYVTATQPMLTSKGWVLAGDLEKGDTVMTIDGEEEIHSIYADGQDNVYDLKVLGGEPSYIANGFIVKAGEDEWQ